MMPQARAIAPGDRVRMFNALGAVEALARVSTDTPAGVVYLPFNWWPSVTLNGSSANALTPGWPVGSEFRQQCL
jgi:anaerobic selenocysteine-containing dehydrogenase